MTDQRIEDIIGLWNIHDPFWTLRAHETRIRFYGLNRMMDWAVSRPVDFERLTESGGQDANPVARISLLSAPAVPT